MRFQGRSPNYLSGDLPLKVIAFPDPDGEGLGVGDGDTVTAGVGDTAGVNGPIAPPLFSQPPQMPTQSASPKVSRNDLCIDSIPSTLAFFVARRAPG
jgi:hypothetical protein